MSIVKDTNEIGGEKMQKLINRNLFLASIKEVGFSTKEISEKLAISKTALYRKINSKSEFTHSEIKAIKEIIPEDKFKLIFFD